MSENQLRARAEIPQREWVEIEVELDGQGVVQKAHFKVWGCFPLIEAAQRASQDILKKKLNDYCWKGINHWDLLVSEVFQRMQGTFSVPLGGEELCHCRKIQAEVIDQAVVLGAHTPERVRGWTTASSGCGTCRPNVEKVIASRLNRAS